MAEMYFSLFLAPLSLLLLLLPNCSEVVAVEISGKAYHDVNVEISDDVPKEHCRPILKALEDTLSAASQTLFTALDAQYHFGDFNIVLPPSWGEDCVPVPSSSSSPPPSLANWQDNLLHSTNATYADTAATRTYGISTGGKSDISITTRHALLGDSMWTKQYGDCGMPGLQVYIPHNALNDKLSGQMFVREWAKYRYGVFDELGFATDPIYSSCYYNEDGTRIAGCSAAAQLAAVADDACQTNKSNAQFALQQQLTNQNRNAGDATRVHVPQIDGTNMFCNAATHNRYAPTKQNYLCERRAILNVIHMHGDFQRSPNVREQQAHPDESEPTNRNTNTHAHALPLPPRAPIFNYRRRQLTRYVVVIDTTLDISLRESWSFLRTAFRKWINYDLMPNTEVGVVLANGQHVERTLALTPLSNATNRDLVASVLPYTPADTRQMTKLNAALSQAVDMQQQRRRTHGAASSVILLIAPGMDPDTNVTQFQQVLRSGQKIHLATINYPGLVARRMPLDSLASSSPEYSQRFSVHEHKLNGEKSYLTTYVQLVNIFMYIGGYYYENTGNIRVDSGNSQLPVEIHRNVIYDNAYGEFYLEKSFGQPAGFYIYTHSVETPLIQALRLISPSGRVYTARSDQRLPVRQITITSPLNETGRWHYEIERYPGNPQPHIVQVMATPQHILSIGNHKGQHATANFSNTPTNGSVDAKATSSVPHINVRAWIVRSDEKTIHENQYEPQKEHTPLIYTLYCDLKYGRLYPVRNAQVHVKAQHYDRYMNLIKQYRVELKDTGAGDSDIQLGDGIYSRHFQVNEPGVYIFDFHIKGLAEQTYTVRASLFDDDHVDYDNDRGAYVGGSEFAPILRQEYELLKYQQHPHAHFNGRYLRMTGGFERYGPLLTYYVDSSNVPAWPLNTTKFLPTAVTRRSSTLGRILNLRCIHQPQNNDIIDCSWPIPDLGILENDNTTSALMYELKYGTALTDIIDEFDSMPYIFNGTQVHSTALTGTPATANALAAVGDLLRYRHNISHTPFMYNKIIYFALRTFDLDGVINHTSNVAQLRIPKEVVPPKPMTDATVNTTNSTDIWTAGTERDTSNESNITGTFIKANTSDLSLLTYILPISFGILLISSILCIVCYMTRCRRNSKEQNHGKQQEQSSQDSQQQHYKKYTDITAATSSTTLSSQLAATTPTTPTKPDQAQPANQSICDNSFNNSIHPNHHVIGIPVFSESSNVLMSDVDVDDDDTCKKRLSASSASHVYTIQQDQHFILPLMQYQQYDSNFILTKVPNNQHEHHFDAQNQHQHEHQHHQHEHQHHQQQTSPLDNPYDYQLPNMNMHQHNIIGIGSNNETPPVVPPLPLAGNNTSGSLLMPMLSPSGIGIVGQQQQCANYDYDYNVMQTLPIDLISQQHNPHNGYSNQEQHAIPPTPPPPTYSHFSPDIYGQQAANVYCENPANAGDRRRRNITMV